MSTTRRMRSLKLPIFLFVAVLSLTVTLTILWNLILVAYYIDVQELSPTPRGGAFHWTFIALGSLLFTVVIVFSSLLGAQLIGQIRMSRRQSNFIASVSHELNSPLSAIKLSAQTLRGDDVPAEQRRRFVGHILEDVERLKRLIANILRAAELDHRRPGLQVDRQTVDVTEYLADLLERAGESRETWQQKAEITLAAAPGLRAELDPVLFRQVIENLVDNAIRYREREPARVAIEVEEVADGLELRVRDDGIGIPHEHLRHIFERFYRVEDDDPKRRRKGTGIGLFVVRSIVEAHGGKVTASSDGPGCGTTVSLRLPRTADRGAP